MEGELITAFKLICSCLLGGLIGYERQSRSKSAGLRTHILVCLGSCMIMVLSIDIYRSVEGLTNADPARLAAQVVSGIGFLGAGTIIKEGPTVKGLTTAASLWVVSGVGLAVGSAHYVSALITTGLAFLTLTTLSRWEKTLNKRGLITLSITSVDQPGQIGKIGSVLGDIGVSIEDIRVEEQHDTVITLGVVLRVPEKVDNNAVLAMLAKVEGIVALKQDS